MPFSRVRVVCSWMYFLFKTTEIYESLQVLLVKKTSSNLIIPVNVTTVI